MGSFGECNSQQATVLIPTNVSRLIPPLLVLIKMMVKTAPIFHHYADQYTSLHYSSESCISSKS